MNLYYLSGTGEKKIDFMGPRYRANIQELLSYEWEYEKSDNVGRNGGKLTGIKRSIASMEMTAAISGENRADYLEALNEFLSITERDVLELTPGKLCLGDNYLTCYLMAASPETDFEPQIPFVKKKITVVSEYPFWCRERITEYFPAGRKVESAEFLDYPHDYPYDYLYDQNAGRLLENDHYAGSDFRLTVYGPAINPKIVIAGHVYEVTTTLYDGEYMIIDSRTNEIYKVTAIGNKMNLFNYRNKTSNIFEKIPVGNNTVIFNQEFGFTITLFQERSTPRWSIS